LLAELFQTSKQNIAKHLKAIFAEGELAADSVVNQWLTTATDGKSYRVAYYNLDAILAVGYRVRSTRGTQFRRWATERLSEYLIKGFTLDDERLKNPPVAGSGVPDRFNELLERIRDIRDIRASERRMYLRVREIFAMAADYSPSLTETTQFFSIIQNKLHFAVTGKTAAELIAERADSSQRNGVCGLKRKALNSMCARWKKQPRLCPNRKRQNEAVGSAQQLRQLQQRPHHRIRPQRGNIFTMVVAVRNRHHRHAGIARRRDVGARITDHPALCGINIQTARRFEQWRGEWLALGQRVAADDLGEKMAHCKLLQKIAREGFGFVGDHGQRQLLRVQDLQRIQHAVVAAREIREFFAIERAVPLMRFGQVWPGDGRLGLVITVSQRALHQFLRAIADPVAYV